MSYYTQWNLKGRDTTGKPLPSGILDRICKALEKEADEWYGDYDACDGSICAFRTDRSSGYTSVTALVASLAKDFPDAIFMLDCHNQDEEWYQRILYHGVDKEELDGYIAYEASQRICYGARSPLPRLVIVLDSGSIQGVFIDGGEDADIVIVDRDESKLEGCDVIEKSETQEWVKQQLLQCRSMRCLYGGSKE